MIIEYASSEYPERLRYIENPPSRLYVEGDCKILNQLGISVIGSRTNTQYGERMCKKFVKKLVEHDLIIISGLAYGIDSIAHKACLKNSGKTIAVLPSGLKNIYPLENRQLAQAIIDNGGAVISEYDDNVKADYDKFLERNRIVAGLGIGTLVVEAGYRSGTSVTARLTEQYGKPVFCIPSSLENIKGKTTNELIRNGAHLVTDVGDILDFYPDFNFVQTTPITKNIFLEIQPDLLDVYKVINNIPQDLNEIGRKTNLPISEVNYKIMMLQLQEKITELSGQRFVLKDDDDI